jgi:hypothetical protein
VTHHEVQVLDDGTRRYSNRTLYRPVPAEERAYGINRPDDPRAERFHGRWFIPLDLLPDARRVMPETRPDELTLEHRAHCRCQVCRRPQAPILWARRARNLARSDGDLLDQPLSQ